MKTATRNIKNFLTMRGKLEAELTDIINADHVKVTMLVKDERLYSILYAMKLITVFDVQKL